MDSCSCRGPAVLVQDEDRERCLVWEHDVRDAHLGTVGEEIPSRQEAVQGAGRQDAVLRNESVCAGVQQVAQATTDLVDDVAAVGVRASAEERRAKRQVPVPVGVILLEGLMGRRLPGSF